MKMFLLGVMVAYTPSLLVLAIMLWQAPELEMNPAKERITIQDRRAVHSTINVAPNASIRRKAPSPHRAG
jgi:hypothetical protein